MNGEVLKQKVNFYISVAFILAFGVFMTTTVVGAINRDAPYLKEIASPSIQNQ